MYIDSMCPERKMASRETDSRFQQTRQIHLVFSTAVVRGTATVRRVQCMFAAVSHKRCPCSEEFGAFDAHFLIQVELATMQWAKYIQARKSLRKYVCFLIQAAVQGYA
jgi:hypothetical protein